MASHRMLTTTVAALVTLASVIPVAAAEGIAQAMHIEADIAGSCYSAVVGFDSFWMTSGGFLYRTRLDDNTITHVPIKGLQSWHSSMAVGEGAVWLLDGLTTIYKIDPQKEQVVNELPIKLDGSGNLAVGEGAVWAIPDGNRLTRYSAASGTEEATVPLPSRSSRVLVAFGSIWVSGIANDELYRIDPTINRIAATIELRARPGALAAGEGSVWVFNEGDGTVQRIDGESGKQLATIETDTLGTANMTVGGGFVWVGTQIGTLIKIDPRTNSVRGKLKTRTGSFFGLGYGGDSLWICGDAAYRIAPPE